MKPSWKEKLWNAPKAWYYFGIPLGGLVFFIIGVMFLAGFNASLTATSTEEFCVSCHGMSEPFKEYKETHHFNSQSGVVATCVDCHLPKEFVPKMIRKTVAMREVWHMMLGSINTAEKFEKKRGFLAQRVWDEMKETDSRECRSCHDQNRWDLEKQSKRARKKHDIEDMKKKDKTCIDCHKGLAHKMPKD
ncbi:MULTISPECIES: NapC/NirT family cytochrome c [unclassified Colwellia]|jgi:cytochrome c-type protein NapC|uniref:NapC/NirT family cytochrome c n=1 Tax=unclassified Colwellia TaxID=196834 RepID=UPI0009F2C657|nr:MULTISPECIES: NapC/NirT family cytochrome c [unclassified Colwellia]MBA6379855.1 NapC/NirT family cytochrome c [Colwellia sp. BRX10-7]MBA6386575.1 NapC/NirT family cytochrome c [Colwellia sp. BRX10-2]MBA6401685.1 NapC/NirT family cytochrome c [Colwellia sp. BRX10-5]MBA6406276.1 NapC/NirT family cytochrome c [Colwellia sp. BRX10-1]